MLNAQTLDDFIPRRGRKHAMEMKVAVEQPLVGLSLAPKPESRNPNPEV